MSSHHRSLSEPFSVARLTNPEPLPPPPPLPPTSSAASTNSDTPVPDVDEAGNSQKRPSSAFAKKSEAEKKKPFKCDRAGCGMAFSRQEHLLRHIRKHTGEKPFHCRICGNSFSRLDNLRQHSQCHERKRRIRNSRRATNVRNASQEAGFVASQDVQVKAEQPVYPIPNGQGLPPMSPVSQISPGIQDSRPVRRRPEPIVLSHEQQYREVTTPPESPASTAGFGGAPPSPFSPYANSISSMASTPTSSNFMINSPDVRSGYNTPYNRYSWTFMDSVSIPSFAASPAEARAPKNARRQTLMAPPQPMDGVSTGTPSIPPTPREPYRSGVSSPRGEGSWFGRGRPMTWHGGPPLDESGSSSIDERILPALPSIPVPRPMPSQANRSNRNSQVYEGDGGRPTLEPDVMANGRNDIDAQAVRMLGLGEGVLRPGNRSSLAESTPASRRYSGTFNNSIANLVSSGTHTPAMNATANGTTSSNNSGVPSRYYSTQHTIINNMRRPSTVYGNMFVSPTENEMIPRSISDEGTRTPGLGGLCALVSAVELQNRE